MTTLRLNPPARLGAHLLAQQRIPHAALTPAGKGVVNLFPGRIVLGQRALLATDSQWFGSHVACTWKMALIMSRALR